jgi:hypothetical protein
MKKSFSSLSLTGLVKGLKSRVPATEKAVTRSGPEVMEAWALGGGGLSRDRAYTTDHPLALRR